MSFGRSIETTFRQERRKEKNVCAHATQVSLPWDLSEKVSSWAKLLRITAYVWRFIHNARVRRERLAHLHLAAAEIKDAKLFWIRAVQTLYFSKEMLALRGGKPIPNHNALLSLSPFLDAEDVLRVGGRLRFATIHRDAKFPVVLPRCRVSSLIIRYTHLRALHGGTQATLRLLRQHYWVLGARNQVKACIFGCVVCARVRALLTSQKMGDLPGIRVTPAWPFANVGIDYADPFLVRSSKGRGQQTHKAYCVLFVCLATRAIHLEVADDYTTDGFLAAFERFSSRRGLPETIYSDNGTNFQGADRELRRRILEIARETDVQNRFASDEITWRFIPPATPHFGGLWEAGVKGVKFHLRRIMGDFKPTFEEFSTLLCKIECMLNSRSLSPLFDDHETFDALTPGHFLVGSHLKAVPNPSVDDIKMNRLSRWQAIQRYQETFWKVWASDYLNSMQQQTRWKKEQSNLRKGDLMLLRNNNLPPAKWDLGRVIDCHPGADSLVRVVTIKTAKSTFRRPVTQLCKLPVESHDSLPSVKA